MSDGFGQQQGYENRIDSENLNAQVKLFSDSLNRLHKEMQKRIVGQDEVGQRLILALVCGGHVLLEGLPGLAKTTTIKTLAEATDLSFKRIQFTPDLLPADVLGTQLYEPKSGDFRTKKGPVFTHLLLADEINRAPAKVQSALLECMQEHQVTLGDHTYALDLPFLVLATQNPIEQEGTYPLPEAQVDRFLFKVVVGYGTHAEEVEIVRRSSLGVPIQIQSMISRQQILEMQSFLPLLMVADKVRKYIVDLVFATRQPDERKFKDLKRYLEFGASPRASIFLEKAARASALYQGRTYVTPQDVKDIALDVLRHRVMLSFEAEAEKVSIDTVLGRILDGVDVP